MTRLIVALWGCIAAAGASAAEWSIVVHGISWHEGKRTETVTETYTVETDQSCYKGRCEKPEPQQVTRAREVTRRFESFNPGLGVRRQDGAVAVQVGAYRNSYGTGSAYVLADWEPVQRGAWSAGLFAGLVSGYDHGITAAGLVARYQGDRIGIALRGMPKVSEKQSGAVAALELTYRIGATR